MAKRLAKKLLLIGWDAADWKMINPLIDEGLMPNLEKLINEGVMGNLATLDPPLSPMLWTSIATGKRPYKHGIHGFSEPDPSPNGKGVRPIYVTNRKVKALWNIFTQQDIKSHVVGWWPSHPAEPINGIMVSNFYQKAHKDINKPWPLTPGTVHPESKSELFANMRIHPQELTQAHYLPFVPKAGTIDQTDPKAQKRLMSVGKIIADCSSIHAAATYIMEFEEWEFLGVYYDAIDHFGHGFMKYHPPHREHIPKDLYELYNNVNVAGYRYHDMMLGRLMELAGEDTTIMLISDHGFHPDHLRPKSLPIKEEPAAPALEHSPFGVIVVKGPGIKKDQRISGATLLDITPTVLTLFGLPVARDMDGKILMDMFETRPEIEILESWELVPGECGMHPEDMSTDEIMSEEVLNQLIELGYIEKPHPNKEKAIERTKEYNTYFLARAYADGKQYEEAIELYKKLFDAKPTNSRYGTRLARTYMSAGKLDEAQATFEAVRELKIEDTPGSLLLEGSLLLAQHKYRSAMDVFTRVEEMAREDLPNLHAQIGRGYVSLKRWADAERALKKELAINYDNAGTHHLLGVTYMRRQQFKEAADCYLTSLSLNYHFPFAHYHLGEALYHLKEYERSAEAFEVCVRMAPNIGKARQWLNRLYKQHLKKPIQARVQRSAIPQNALGTIVVVSGLPRSGTSMMMQMLEKGGMDIFTDKKREADENNPKGYYEHEAVKALARDKKFLRNVGDKAVKIIAQLLPHLPMRFKYKVIFMDRELNEVLRSQHKMLTRLGKTTSNAMPLKLVASFENSLKRVRRWVPKQPNIEMLVVPHRGAINNPMQVAQEVNAFLGGHLDVKKMAAVVDRSLHREKIEKTPVIS